MQARATFPDLGPLLDPLRDATNAAAREAGVRVRVRSQVAPELTLDVWQGEDGATRTESAGAGGGIGEALLRFARPSVYLEGPGFSYAVEPYGRPERNYSAALALGTVAVGLLAWKGWRAWQRRR